jgi:hypothetical protein
MSVEMELSRILIRETNDYQIIELREIDGERTFPIVIGLPEAQAIERRLRGIEIKRPQTHELLANIIESFGGELASITITNLEEQTFYATLDIKKADGQMMNVDSRPSDAIALGIAKSVPIYVAEQVLEGAQRSV